MLAHKKESGFTFVEILVSMLILAISVISVLWLMGVSISSNMQAGYRVQANYLVESMADRLRLNSVTAKAGGYTVALPNGTAFPSCFLISGCTSTQLAANDIFEWQNTIKSYLPAGSGTITGTNPFTISVTWKRPVDVSGAVVSVVVRLP